MWLNVFKLAMSVALYLITDVCNMLQTSVIKNNATDIAI